MALEIKNHHLVNSIFGQKFLVQKLGTLQNTNLVVIHSLMFIVCIVPFRSGQIKGWIILPGDIHSERQLSSERDTFLLDRKDRIDARFAVRSVVLFLPGHDDDDFQWGDFERGAVLEYTCARDQTSIQSNYGHDLEVGTGDGLVLRET